MRQSCMYTITYYDKVTDGSLTAGAYQVLHSWSESGTSGLTWNMASPSTNTYISSTRLSAGPFSGSRGAYANSPKTVSFDVTSAAEAWYEGTSPNYGIALKYEGGKKFTIKQKTQSFPGSESPCRRIILFENPPKKELISVF